MDKKLKFFAYFRIYKGLILFICSMGLSISNANSIQFWLAGEESFNQKEICSIYPVCFCQPIRCDDLVRVQIHDTDSSKAYNLLICDPTGFAYATLAFTKTVISDGAKYDCSFTPNQLGTFAICQGQYNFFIQFDDGAFTQRVAYSDCFEFTTDENLINCTNLIQYSNSTNFAGLYFTSSSPSTYFYLRVPSVFFEENFPQEQEDLELSDDTIITLWSKIEGKKMLDIGFMPFYMHKKLQMILMMDNVIIDGIAYRLRDPYQIAAPASKRSALRRASVLLSEKDFINRNLL